MKIPKITSFEVAVNTTFIISANYNTKVALDLGEFKFDGNNFDLMGYGAYVSLSVPTKENVSLPSEAYNVQLFGKVGNLPPKPFLLEYVTGTSGLAPTVNTKQIVSGPYGQNRLTDMPILQNLNSIDCLLNFPEGWLMANTSYMVGDTVTIDIKLNLTTLIWERK